MFILLKSICLFMPLGVNDLILCSQNFSLLFLSASVQCRSWSIATTVVSSHLCPLRFIFPDKLLDLFDSTAKVARFFNVLHWANLTRYICSCLCDTPFCPIFFRYMYFTVWGYLNCLVWCCTCTKKHLLSEQVLKPPLGNELSNMGLITMSFRFLWCINEVIGVSLNRPAIIPLM